MENLIQSAAEKLPRKLPGIEAAQAESWHRNGWVVLDTALPGTARDSLSRWVEEVAAEPAAGQQRLHYWEQTDKGRTMCRTEHYIEDHAALHRLITTGALPALASLLLGEPAVLYKEKVNYKQPGGAGFNPHQDATAYAFIQHHVTCMVAVDAMTRENGCLEFAPFPERRVLPDDGDGCIAAAVAATLDWRAVEVPAGGVVFFTSHVPHRSGPNLSAAPRRALYLTYNALSEGDRRSEYYRERDRAIAERAEHAEPADGAAARVSTIGHFRGRQARQEQT